jgi:hypothetical protein
MNIPLAHTVDGLIVDATTLPVGDKLVAHPYPASFGTDGFFHDLEIL